ncbi:BglG family transcription antiterminator [Clostridium sp. BJN0001]|uniref:BglG family transcription antiterminator n=1 Tax=Clostridium sp. BJN0001 TaxID=2930219 RepID=UPI001FD150D8|nr:BglG family transcription antiterminator [Clostridium sp. BJN0001]
MFNRRCSNILDIIIGVNKPIMINELAKKINISSRTIRYDLDKIDEYLKEIGFPKLQRKPNVGISLNLNDQEINNLFKILGKINTYDYIFSQKERILYMLCELLTQNDFMTINSLSDKMMVSRNTIINDLNEAKKWIFENKLVLESLKGHGIRVTGKEIDLRKATTILLFQSMDLFKNKNISTEKLFKDIDINFIKNTIKVAENQMESSFSDEAFNNLVIHIAIAVKRIQLSKDIIMDKEELKNLRKTAEFAISSGIARMLEEKFEILIPEDEIGYITVHLLGSNIASLETVNKYDWINVQLITSTLIENVQIKSGINFTQDSHLFEGLVQHIRPVLYRLKHNLKVKNPLINEIKENYFDVFENVKESVKFIEDKTNSKINDEEIGYITLHFMASIEKLKNKNHKILNVIVVCSTGIGTSKFVSMKLKSIFDINIIDTVSSHDLEKALKNNDKVDLIITTVPLNVTSVKCIKVNAFLTEKNISDLSLFFAEVTRRNVDTEENKINEVLNIISENCTINNYDKLKSALISYLKLNDIKNYKPHLKELINVNFVKINGKSKTWENAVRESGQILKNNGCVNNNYIDAMVDTVKNVGAYIVVLKGIAMPHAMPSDGALKTGISILVLKEPVCFGSEENDPVRVVIGLSTIDKINHVNALKDLMKIIEKEDFIQKIINAKSEEEVVNLILDRD